MRINITDFACGDPDQLLQALDDNQDIEFKGLGNATPLIYAAKRDGNASEEEHQQRLMCLQLLLERGANVHARDNFGDTAILQASEDNNNSGVALLVRHNAAVNDRNSKTGDTPLINAARIGDVLSVRLLLENGAKKDIKNNEGEDACYAAAASGHAKCVELLIPDQSATQLVAHRDAARMVGSRATLRIIDQHLSSHPA